METVNEAIKRISTNYDVKESYVKFLIDNYPDTKEPNIDTYIYFKTKTLKNREMVDVYVKGYVKNLTFDTKSNFRWYKVLSGGRTFCLPFNAPDNFIEPYETIKNYILV